MSREEGKDKFLPKKKRSWKSVLAFVIFILINAAVIIITATSEFGNSSEATELSKVQTNWWLFIPATLCFLIAISFDIYRYVLMIKKMSKDEPKQKTEKRKIWKVARRTVLLGKYYDSVTPAAIGGQPFQIYYMRKNSGLGRGESVSIPLVGMIANQIGFLIIAIICFLFSGIAYSKPALMVTAWFGLLFFAFWPVMIGGISYFPKVTIKFLEWIIKALAKLHIIKDREKATVAIKREIDEYSKSVKTILKERGLFIRVIFLSVLYNALIMSIPFFVLTAFGGNVGFLECFSLSVAVTSAVYFIPTPGNAGAAEGTFFLVFSSLSSGYVFWAMLFWRLFSYYIYIIIGPFIYFSMHLEKKRLDKNANKKNV